MPPILPSITLHIILKLSIVYIVYFIQFSTMSTSTSSTPLTLFNTSASPTILSQEMTATSFYSAVPTIPELPQNDKKCVSKVYHSILLMGILICVSFLLYLVIHVNFHMKFSGEFQSNLGNLNISLQSEGVFNLSSTVNSSVKTAPSQLWEQIYIDNVLS